MSDEEIVALLQEVTNEMVRRGIEKTAKLAQGTYIAGIDFPCGKYMYTCLAKDDDWATSRSILIMETVSGFYGKW